jgi:hypothetical protein
MLNINIINPCSPIIFLFFIADLLDITNCATRRISSVGFVDDINVLMYSTATESNCVILESIYREYEK